MDAAPILPEGYALTLRGYTSRLGNAQGREKIGGVYTQLAAERLDHLTVLGNIAKTIASVSDVADTIIAESAPKTSDGYGWRVCFEYITSDGQVAILFPYMNGEEGTSKTTEQRSVA